MDFAIRRDSAPTSVIATVRPQNHDSQALPLALEA